MSRKQCVLDLRNGKKEMIYYNHNFVVYVTPKTIAASPDFVRFLRKKTKLANIFAGFLEYLSSKANIHHPTANLTNLSTPGPSYTVCTQSVKGKDIGDLRAVTSPCPGIRTAIYCPQEIP